MKLSIIVVNWNTRELLINCLKSIQADQEILCQNNLFIPTEIIVVDNASDDSSVKMVRSCFPEVKVIDNQENVGFARANNQAIQISHGQYILLLNPDTEIKPGTLKTLVSFMDDNSQVGAAGAQLINSDGTLQSSCHPAPTLSREFWRLFHLDKFYSYSSYPMETWPVDTHHKVEVVQGACLILRKDILNQVGVLDEDYFMYSEEVDLCFRIRKKGWNIYWVPLAQVVHYGGQSTQQVATRMFLRLYEAKLIYFRKNHGFLAGQIYKLILFSASFGRLIVSPLAYIRYSSQRQQHMDLAHRYWLLVCKLPSW